MDSFFGERKIVEKVTKFWAAGTSFAQRIRARASINWPRVSNTEQEDVGNLEVGGEIEVNNSTTLENQNVVQVVVTGAPPDASAVAVILPNSEDFGNQDDNEEENQDDLEEGNQDHIQDVGDLEAGGEVEVNNSTMVGNQNVFEVLEVPLGTAGNQDDVQEIVIDASLDANAGAAMVPNTEGGDPDVVGEDPTGESSEVITIKLTYAQLNLVGGGLLVMNMRAYYLHNSYGSSVMTFASTGLAIHSIMMRPPSGRWTRYVWLLLVVIHVLVTSATFA